MPCQMHVYILASLSRRLYTGVTNHLRRRVAEHRAGSPGSFTARYSVTKLVYWETFPSPSPAIAREKEIKSWTREKRLRLIEESNPGWLDLAVDWYPDMG